MSSAEQLAWSMQCERRGIHLLIWNDQHDLVRALMILRAAMTDVQFDPILVPTVESELAALCNNLYDAQGQNDSLRMLFIPQAANTSVGPWLNGARIPLSNTPGTLLIVRSPDLSTFQRWAPDLASFVGPRIFDAASMLSIVSSETAARIEQALPEEFVAILNGLPGSRPAQDEIDSWLLTLSRE